jgi:hypothetical protein
VVYSRGFGSKRLSNVINLNKYRKQKAKVEREKQADVNRRLHGRTKGERSREELQKQQLTRAVDGARLVGPAAGTTAPESEGQTDVARSGESEEPSEPERS